MITIIAAIATNNALGKNNDLIWHLPADLRHFKEITSGNTIIMGRKTFESIGRVLPNRTTIIITRNSNYFVDGCLIAHSLEQALELAKQLKKEIFIIGGEQIYRYALSNNLVDAMEITFVHHTFDADAFFPKIDTTIWKEVKRENNTADEKNKYNYSFVRLEKI